MSDTAIFIAATADDLKSNNGLPGDIGILQNQISDSERVVHTEMIADAAMPERFVNTLSQNGALVTVLPATSDGSAALTTGLTARLHEFICSFPNVNQFLLAGIEVNRLALAAAYLRRAGFQVLVAGPDQAALDRLGSLADDTFVWGKTSGSPARRPARAQQQNREETSESPDPFDVLVEEVTKSRSRGNRVLLTSLKQRMRKRIRRFDETRLKDKDGRPMRKFKDFVVDAANRGLIQLIERGNSSHVLLPGEDINTEDDDEEETPARSERRNPKETDENDDVEIDPLLDAVDMIGEESDSAEDDAGEASDTEENSADEPAAPEEPLSVDDIDPLEIDEEANPPPVAFLELLENVLKTPLTLEDLVAALVKKQQEGAIQIKKRALRDHLQAAFNNELLENPGDEKPLKYSLVDDWRDIIDYL
ncbi:MAG: hypothetical protein JJU05_10010 [Verrucomicrobia bacterium]|nr:hypothetical protein [Verrucomicrobiota bacterium]MCH8526623.1 hypothetical protein [Kiritimatiellia bacterium]